MSDRNPMNEIAQTLQLLWLAIQTLAIRAYTEAKRLWAVLLALLGFGLMGCANYEARPVRSAVECSQFWQCDRIARDTCPDGKYLVIADTNTSLVFQCEEEGYDDTTRARSFNP